MNHAPSPLYPELVYPESTLLENELYAAKCEHGGPGQPVQTPDNNFEEFPCMPLLSDSLGSPVGHGTQPGQPLLLGCGDCSSCWVTSDGWEIMSGE